MTPAKGIHAHPLFKLGSIRPIRDPRTLDFSDILRVPVAVPRLYDFDLAHPGIPTPMFGNDEYGDCVLAGRAHQTLRFERMEQGKAPRITDADVLAEYFAETGGADVGLDPLLSLKAWRNRGWNAAGRRYFIRAYAEVNPRQHDAVRQAVFMDIGVGLALDLPLTAQAQVQAGRLWDVVAGGNASAPGSWGGHYAYVCGYTAAGPVCVTWGRKQAMTWAFVDRYCDAIFAVIDARDNAKAAAALDFDQLDARVRHATA